MKSSSDDIPAPGLLGPFREPAVRIYFFIGFAALIIYYLLMSARGGDIGLLFTFVLAIIGLAARWVISPVLFLMLTTFLLIDPGLENLSPSAEGFQRSWRIYGERTRYLRMEDLILAGSVLIYMMAQFRLLSVAHKSMPDDPPPRRKGQPNPITPRRPARMFADREIGIIFKIAPLCVLAGGACWLLLARYESSRSLGRTWGIEQPFARLMLFLWAFITATILASVSLRYLAMRRMNRRQARLMLQDMFWQETRREQERIYRWRHWYKKRQADLPAERG